MAKKKNNQNQETRNRFVEERHQRILQLLDQKNRVVVPDLAEKFKVSEDTIRRDLRHLENLGLLKKTHGGAIHHHISSLGPYPERLEAEKDYKTAIGKRAAELVEENDSLLINSSTTALAFARALQVNRARIITNDLDIAQIIIQKGSYELFVLGGKWDPAHHELMGPNIYEQIERFRVQKLFLGVSALHPIHGMTGITEEDASIKRAMIQVADQVIALSDHTKIGETSLAWIAPPSVIDILVTDEHADCEGFEEYGFQIIKATG